MHTSKRRSPPPLGALGRARIAASGITIETAERAGLRELDAAATQALDAGYLALPSLVIPYWSATGTPLAAHAGWAQFHRVRYLATPTGTGFAAKKTPRYAQPAGTGVCAYIPPVIDWAAVLADTSVPLWITEGELKALKAAQEGIACVGLGGVFNYRCRQTCTLFLPELVSIGLVRRSVYVAYDSDARTNDQVVGAINALARELELHGAVPHLVELPPATDDSKVGLDDYLLSHSADDLRALAADAPQLALTRALWQLNDEVAYVRDPAVVVRLAEGQLLPPNAFTAHAYSHRSGPELVAKPGGGVQLVRKPLAKRWLEWPLRREVSSLTYAPGRPRLVDPDDGVGLQLYNSWSGWGVEPRRGDAQPFRDLVEHVFEGAPREAREWFLDWCAYPLQNPGAKLFTAVVLHGVRQGTGKSLLGYTLGAIYGRNFTEINQQHLDGTFNEWAVERQFVLGDDVTGSDKRADADRLKKLITQKIVRVNRKYLPSYDLPDTINYLFTSNQSGAFFLEDEDRRFFVHEVVCEPLTAAFTRPYDARLRDGSLPAAVFHWLLQRDLSGFVPTAKAFGTAAKARMVATVKSDLAAFVASLRDDPDAVLRDGGVAADCDLYTSQQLVELYRRRGGSLATTAQGLARVMRDHGFRQVCDGTPLRVGSAAAARYFAVRNADTWITATSRQVLKHLAERADNAGAPAAGGAGGKF